MHFLLLTSHRVHRLLSKTGSHSYQFDCTSIIFLTTLCGRKSFLADSLTVESCKGREGHILGSFFVNPLCLTIRPKDAIFKQKNTRQQFVRNFLLFLPNTCATSLTHSPCLVGVHKNYRKVYHSDKQNQKVGLKGRIPSSLIHYISGNRA